MNCNNWFLYFTSVIANLFSFSIGSLLVWNSPVIPKLQSNNTYINPLGSPITTLEVSLSSSIIPIGSTIGTLFVGKLAEIYGRRKTLIYLAAGSSISSSALVFVNDISDIYYYLTFMLILSVCISAAFVIVPVYVSEIAENHNRGKVGCFLSVAVAIGELYAFSVGPVTSVGMFSLLCGLPSFLFLICCMFIPESPIFLVSKGDEAGAKQSLEKLRHNKSFRELDVEYFEKEKMILVKAEEVNNHISILFKTRSGKKALMLSIGLRIIQQLSGVFVVLSFLAPLFKEAGSQLSGETLTIIISAINIPIAILALNIIDRLGRKFLLLMASFFDGFSLCLLGLYLYFKENSFAIPDELKLLPIFCLFCFYGMFTFGLGNVPFIVISEILPNEVRSVGSSIVLVTGNLSAFVLSFAYPLVSEYFGTYTSMFCFSFFNFSGFIFIYLLLPETKGKSFLEIQEELEK